MLKSGDRLHQNRVALRRRSLENRPIRRPATSSSLMGTLRADKLLGDGIKLQAFKGRSDL